MGKPIVLGHARRAKAWCGKGAGQGSAYLTNAALCGVGSIHPMTGISAHGLNVKALVQKVLKIGSTIQTLLRG